MSKISIYLFVLVNFSRVWIPIISYDSNAASKDFSKLKLKVLTVATEKTDGYQRYMRSARVYGIEVITLGLDKEWVGFDMNGRGGYFKIDLLREALQPLKDAKDIVVMFTDNNDVVFTTGSKEILQKFKDSGVNLLFSAEKFCWPDEKLAVKYPAIDSKESPYLNSGAFIGYAPQIYELLEKSIKDAGDDDQLYYTKAFLNKKLRKQLGMQLDTKSNIFQCLNGAKNDVKLQVDLDTNEGTMQNINFMTKPSVIHGNGPSKIVLNAFANYLAKPFDGQYLMCQENRINLDEENLPLIMIAIIALKAAPFYDMFLTKIEQLNYPKKKIHLFIYSGIAFYNAASKSFFTRLHDEYASATVVVSTDQLDERHGRQRALQQAKQTHSDYLFSVDAVVHIDDPELLRELLIRNRQFIAPVVSKHNDLWSNCLNARSEGNAYARSHDYVDIVKRKIIGMWNVPYVSSIYLIKSSAFKYIKYDGHLDPDMALCESLRIGGIFMYITNEHIYGHLVNTDGFNISLKCPDFYSLHSNKFDWAKKYIHPKYFKQLEPNTIIPQPCTDVFWFQIGTDAFCDDLVAIMENYGKWSNGDKRDNRIEGGYDPIPSRDIHLNQVGLHELWLEFLKHYVTPLQQLAFHGYYNNQPESQMSFVVRYRPGEQPELRPHHDDSTYTVNIALNNVGIDYQGGGCRFIRYNCSITETKKGWFLMHPGRFTHYHEGMPVTNGTRYIMVSFVDP